MELDANRENLDPGDPGAVAEGMDAYTRHADYALQVVTVTSASGEPSGCVVGFLTQCSIVPPRFLVCLSKVNHTYGAAEHAGALTLHLVSRDQRELVSLFAEQTGDDVDKFRRCDWHPGVTGSPVLAECVAWLEAVIIDRWSVGDHQALLVRPVAGGSGGSGESGGHGEVLTMQNAPDLHPGHPVA